MYTESSPIGLTKSTITEVGVPPASMVELNWLYVSPSSDPVAESRTTAPLPASPMSVTATAWDPEPEPTVNDDCRSPAPPGVTATLMAQVAAGSRTAGQVSAVTAISPAPVPLALDATGPTGTGA